MRWRSVTLPAPTPSLTYLPPESCSVEVDSQIANADALIGWRGGMRFSLMPRVGRSVGRGTAGGWVFDGVRAGGGGGVVCVNVHVDVEKGT
jgi:hypothetical protein